MADGVSASSKGEASLVSSSRRSGDRAEPTSPTDVS